MSKKLTHLEIEITALSTKLKNLQEAIDLMREQIGYEYVEAPYASVDPFFFAPEISICKKADALISYLNVEINKIEKEEQIVVLKKRPVRPRRSVRRIKNATKKQDK